MVKIEKDLDKIVDGLMKRIAPLMLLEVAETRASRNGLLTGPKAISEYLGHSYTPGSTSRRYLTWYQRYGMPLSKTPEGNWCTSKSMIDKWLQKREMMMRLYRQLGFYVPNARYKDGKCRDVPPEKMTQDQKDAIIVKYNEDKASMRMKHG